MSFLPLILPFNPGQPQVHLSCPCFHQWHPLEFCLPSFPVFPDSSLSTGSSDLIPQLKPVLNEMLLAPHMLILTPQREGNCDKNQISNIPTIFPKLCPSVLDQWQPLYECDFHNRIKMSWCYLPHSFSKLSFSTWPSKFTFQVPEDYWERSV